LRRAFRTAMAGDIVHTRDYGWCIYLGRGAQGGVGLFLAIDDRSIRLLTEYRQIDFLPDDLRVEVPEPLIEPADPSASPAALVGEEALDHLTAAVAGLDLPDLDAAAAAYREREAAARADQHAALDQEIAE